MKPLVEKLQEHLKNAKAKFHMPGHDGNICISTKMDITEIEGMDNLLSSQGVILEAENLVAKAYNKRFALYSTQGSTLFMHVCLNIAKNENLKVVALYDMHSSFYNAVKLYDIQYSEAKSLEEVKSICQKTQSKCVIFSTCPNYFGNCIDLIKLNEIAKKYNAKLFIDSAHGAHFAYSSLLPEMASNYADITFYSMHKTMSALTGSAILVCDDEHLYNLAKYYRSLIHSTSPNYMVMASMDEARDVFINIGEEAYKKIKEKIDSFNNNLGGFEIIKSDDFSRLVLKKDGVNCYDVLTKLNKIGIDVEMAYLDELVLIVTPYNYMNLDKVDIALKNMEFINLENTQIEYNPKKIDDKFTSIGFVEIEDALDRVSASQVGIYPPSIPLVKEKDLIDKSIIDALLAHKEHLFGLVNGKIAVLK